MREHSRCSKMGKFWAWTNPFESAYNVYAALALGVHSCTLLFLEVTIADCSGK